MGDFGWICGVCTDHNEGSRTVCAMCSTERSGAWHHLPFFQPHRSMSTARALRSLTNGDGTLPFPLSIFVVPRFLAGALSGALTGMFAVVGAFTGAVTGALAGRATDSGLLRGAGLGAIAGAVLSVEVLEASRAYWNSERTGAQPSSSVAEFIEDLVNGRFMQDQVSPAMRTANRWQVNLTEMSYEDLYEMFGPGDGVIKGVCETFLEKLPQHTVTKDDTDNGDRICCAICLQELVPGEQARSLPLCHHVFHMPCVDKWLVRHGSCPVCRQGVQGKI